MSKVDLLILDDFGMAALNAVGRNDLLEVIECRNDARSTLIISMGGGIGVEYASIPARTGIAPAQCPAAEGRACMALRPAAATI